MSITLNGKEYNFDDRICTVLAPATELDLQEFVNDTREVEANLLASHYPGIILASGKQPLGDGTQFVGITVSLINGWRIAFAAAAGPTWETRTISGGNLVAFTDDGSADPPQTQFPVAPTSFIQGFVAQSSSATITGLDTSIVAAAVWDEAQTDHNTADSFGEALNLARKIHTNRLDAAPGNPGTLILYDDDGITPLKTWNLRDYLAAAVSGVPGVPALRGAAT